MTLKKKKRKIIFDRGNSSTSSIERRGWLDQLTSLDFFFLKGASFLRGLLMYVGCHTWKIFSICSINLAFNSLNGKFYELYSTDYIDGATLKILKFCKGGLSNSPMLIDNNNLINWSNFIGAVVFYKNEELNNSMESKFWGNRYRIRHDWPGFG